MLNKIFEAAGMGVLVLFAVWMSSCGNGDGGEWAGWGNDSRDNLIEDTGGEVVLCPKSGGQVKLLELDSLTVSGSALTVPPATIHLVDTPPPARFAALTDDALHLIPMADMSRLVSFSVPKVSKESSVITRGEEMLILDREARKLVGLDLRSGELNIERTFLQEPEEVYYSPSRGKVILVLKKAGSGVLNVLTRSSGESMAITLDGIVCSVFAEDRGEIYLVTEGPNGSALESFRIDDLSKSLDVKLEESSGSITYAKGCEKLYAYTPSTGIIVALNPEDGGIESEIPLDVRGDGRLFSDDTGQHVYLLVKETGHLSVISTDKDFITGEIEGDGGDTRLMTTPHSRYILLQDKGDSRVRLYDGVSFQLLRVFMEGGPVTLGLLRTSTETDGKEDVLAGNEKPKIHDAEPAGDVVESSESVARAGLFTLQVFSSDSLRSSEKVADDLMAAGFPSMIEEAVVAGKGTWYRVKVGEFANREDAAAVGSYLSNAYGLDFWPSTVKSDEPDEAAGTDMIVSGYDMDEDGYPELAIVDPSGEVLLFSLHGNRFVKRWSYALPEGQSLCGVINYADRNSDGLPEALLPLCPSESSLSVAWNGDVFAGQSG